MLDSYKSAPRNAVRNDLNRQINKITDKIIKKELLNIKIQPLPNGYALTVNKSEYMYFNPKELLEGFIYHVGLEELDEVDNETRLDIIAASLTWKENGEAIKELIKQKKINEKLENANKRLQNNIKRLEMKFGKVANDDNNDGDYE